MSTTTTTTTRIHITLSDGAPVTITVEMAGDRGSLQP